jgi:hypothetical protein
VGQGQGPGTADSAGRERRVLVGKLDIRDLSWEDREKVRHVMCVFSTLPLVVGSRCCSRRTANSTLSPLCQSIWTMRHPLASNSDVRWGCVGGAAGVATTVL